MTLDPIIEADGPSPQALSAMAREVQSGWCVAGQRLAAILEAGAADGLDVEPILEANGLPAREQLAAPDILIDLTTFFRVERDMARAFDDLTAHLSTRKLTFETGTFIVQQIGQSVTLEEAIEALARYFNMMHGGPFNQVHRSEKRLTLRIDDTAFPYTMKHDAAHVRFVGECVQIQVHCLLDSLSSGLAAQALRRVGVVREEAWSDAPHLRFWAAPLVSDQPLYSLSYDLDQARMAMPRPGGLDLSSDGLLTRVIDYLEQSAPVAGVQRISLRTRDLIQSGMLQQERIARHLGISVATLRRRLGDEGTSFRDLLRACQEEEACRMLQAGHSVSQVTEALHYSDIRAFNRAFKRWTGVTPAAYGQAAKRQS
ncbi:MAG: helix-turn-helix domain-containing protein [Pseudomonadota bacterium]